MCAHYVHGIIKDSRLLIGCRNHIYKQLGGGNFSSRRATQFAADWLREKEFRALCAAGKGGKVRACVRNRFQCKVSERTSDFASQRHTLGERTALINHQHQLLPILLESPLLTFSSILSTPLSAREKEKNENPRRIHIHHQNELRPKTHSKVIAQFSVCERKPHTQTDRVILTLLCIIFFTFQPSEWDGKQCGHLNGEIHLAHADLFFDFLTNLGPLQNGQNFFKRRLRHLNYEMI